MTSIHPRSDSSRILGREWHEAQAARAALEEVLDQFCNRNGCYRWKSTGFSEFCTKHLTPEQKRKYDAQLRIIRQFGYYPVFMIESAPPLRESFCSDF